MRYSGSALQGVFRILAVLVFGSGVMAFGQEADRESTVKFNFAESIRLEDLVEYVSERTQTRFIYDEGLKGDVAIRSPLEVNVSDLIPILESILEFKGYRITEEDGWYRIERQVGAEIVRQEQPRRIFLSADAPEELRPNSVYTLLLELRHVDADEFSSTVKSAVGLNPIKVPRSRTLIFTDYGSRIALALTMAGLLDQPGPPLTVASYAFERVQVSQVKEMALGLLRAQVLPDVTEGSSQAGGPMLFVDQATNRIILLAPAQKLVQALDILASLDSGELAEVKSHDIRNTDARQAIAFIKEVVRARAPGLKEITVQLAGHGRLLVIAPPVAQEIVADALQMLDEGNGLRLEYYVIEHVQASRIETLARPLLGLTETEGGRGEMLMVASEENTLIARLTPKQHRGLEDILKRFDTAHEAVKATRTQFYQIRNTDAAELAQRLRAILGVAGAEEPRLTRRPPGDLIERSQYLGILRTDEQPRWSRSRIPETLPSRPKPQEPERDREETAAGGPAEWGPVRIVADENTNTIIVQAPIEYHETIARLVEYLDRRRPQVLIEATIATVSVSSDLTVAVEILHNDDTGAVNALVFSAFGLSTVDLATGTLTLKPGSGLNASIVDEDGTSAIIRALRRDSKSRVIAEPKILVNDNAEGHFESVQEEPFTSVNIGETVSTTTFAGYAEAGITISVIPRISEGNFVVLDYTITSRDFGKTSAEPGVPPARTSDVIASSVTVPDGHTVIVGGLLRKRGSLAQEKVPVLGSIPIIGTLFRSRTRGASGSRFFVFLRPVILRDDDFTDLKSLSRADLMGSTKRVWGPDGMYPPVEPKVIR